MDRQEISKNFCIDNSLISKYIEAKIIDNKASYTDDDIRQISLAMGLEKTGFSLEDTVIYLRLNENKEKNKEKMISMLESNRKLILEQIHLFEKQISSTDYLIYELRRND